MTFPERPYDEERLGELIGALPPAPEAWVKAAMELPAARAELDEIVARAEADQAFRAAAIADLEAALREEGVEPSPALVEAIRYRLER
jgi:hypothetical protein